MNLEEAKRRARSLFGPLAPPEEVPMIELGRDEAQGLGFFEQLSVLTPSGFPIPALLWFGLTVLLELHDEGREEKVAWTVSFRINGATYAFQERKFGLRLLCEVDKVRSPTTTQVLGKARALTDIVEAHLAGSFAMDQVKEGNFTMENLFHKLDERYRYLRKQAERAYSRPPPKPKQGKSKHGTWYRHDTERPVRQGGALGTAAVEAYFSRSEHLFCLVSAFQRNVPTDGFVDFLASNWRTKIQYVLNLQDPKTKIFYDRLRAVREEWRNPLAHGGFLSGGASLYFHLPGIGALPAKMRRTPEGPRLGFRLAEESFSELMQLFDAFDDFLRTGPLHLPFRWIESGLDVAFDSASREEYQLNMHTDEDFEHFLDGVLRRRELELNMDW